MSNTRAPMDWREVRRRRAWELKEQGWKQCDIAAALGVTPGAVSQWLKRGHSLGVEALRRRPAPGPTPKLTAEQLAQIPALLERGAEAYGFRGERWTCTRVVAVIRPMFGVAYHPAHVSRLLHALRQSVQRPIARAPQRNEQAIQAWWQDRWPALEKKAFKEGRTVVWVDQSGFYLLPLVVRTWAPQRQTPILRVPLTRDHLAAIGGLTPDGRLFLQTQDRAYHSPDVVRFLRLLLRKLRGKLLLIWEGAPIHRGQPIKDLLTRGAAKRLQLEQLPGYAPELNLAQGV